MWFPRNKDMRSSGWSGSEQQMPTIAEDFYLGRRSGISESLAILRGWHELLLKDLGDRPSDVVLQMREQSVRLAIQKVEGLL
jgi:hypothetical protein